MESNSKSNVSSAGHSLERNRCSFVKEKQLQFSTILFWYKYEEVLYTSHVTKLPQILGLCYKVIITNQ